MSPWIFGFILIELVVISIIDVKTKKISNFWPLAQLLAAALLFFILPGFYPWSWTVLIYPLVWFVLGFFFFLIGIMGAGDSKLLSTLFLLIPIPFHQSMLEKLLISTIVVGFVNLLLKILRDFAIIKSYALSGHWKGLWDRVRSRFSFAPVVLIAWILLGVQIWT